MFTLTRRSTRDRYASRGQWRAQASLEQRAITAFGTTEDFQQASFVLPDGTMLAWPGGGSGIRTREAPNHHPDLAKRLTGEYKLDPLLDRGWLRVQNFRDTLVASTGQPLTPAQASRLRIGAEPFYRVVLEGEIGSALEHPHCEASPPTPSAVNGCIRDLNQQITEGRIRYAALLERIEREHPGMLSGVRRSAAAP